MLVTIGDVQQDSSANVPNSEHNLAIVSGFKLLISSPQDSHYRLQALLSALSALPERLEWLPFPEGSLNSANSGQASGISAADFQRFLDIFLWREASHDKAKASISGCDLPSKLSKELTRAAGFYMLRICLELTMDHIAESS